ncbi:hypothetical protein WN943_026539 [Citrus x changshan-huyou]
MVGSKLPHWVQAIATGPLTHGEIESLAGHMKRRRDAQSDTCVYASSSITANPINKLFNHSYSQPPANHFSPFPSDPKDAGIAWRRPLSKVWRWQNSDLDPNVSASKFRYMHPGLDSD